MKEKVIYAKNKAKIAAIVAEEDNKMQHGGARAAAINSDKRTENPFPYKFKEHDYYKVARICHQEGILMGHFIDRAISNEINLNSSKSIPVSKKEKRRFQPLFSIRNWLLSKIKRNLRFLKPN